MTRTWNFSKNIALIPSNKYVKKRKTKKKPKKNTTATSITVPRNTVCPDIYKCKLTYSQSMTLSGSIGTIAYNVFRGNSMFDPDRTAGGGQCMGRDQISALYQKYLVHGSSIKAVFICTSTPTAQVAVLAKTTDSIVPNFDVVRERNFNDVKYTGTANSGRNIVKCKKYMSTAKMFGIKKDDVTLADNRFDTKVGNNPTDEWFWHCYVQSTDQVSTATCILNVILTYYVSYHDRVPLAQS